MLIILSLFFCGLFIREIMNNRHADNRFDPFNISYLALLILLIIVTAWSPIKYWQFESMIARKMSYLTDVKDISFQCNSTINAIFDNDIGVAGHANPQTREVVFQLGWCNELMDYLDDPQSATRKQRFSFHMFVHEAMHIRGEMNEAKTDCQALQRTIYAASLLGVPEAIAHQHLQDYYQQHYPHHPYFSAQCAEGKSLDEGLDDAPWSNLI